MLAVISVSLGGIVTVVLYLLAAAVVLGLLWYLVGYMEKEWGGPPLMYKVARTVMVVLVVLLLIGLILSFVGEPLFEFHR